MNTILSLVAAVSLLSAPVALAKTPRTLQNLKNAFVHKGLVRKEIRPMAPQCANFTGKWQGICTDQDGETESHALSIEQEDCSIISFDGMSFNINGSISLSSMPNREADDDFPYSATLAYTWNDSQTKLKGLTTFSVFGGFVAGIVGHSMWLAGDQLRTKDEHGTPLMDVDGPTGFQLVMQDCIYDRVDSAR